MNRYTFKAKRVDNGELVYGNFINPKYIVEELTYVSTMQFIADCQTKSLEGVIYEIIPETLCQCTGLQDRDGKAIFENDIVELNNVEFRVDYSYGSFEFSHDCDIDKNCDDADYINPIDYKVDECKIIGNKFDKEED